MKYQRIMHLAFGQRVVPVGVRRAAVNVAFQADEEIKRLVIDLRLAAETFRHYEDLHRAKGTGESDAKAEVNGRLAARFEATIRSAA
jgi:hypothetical protein